LVTAIQVTIRWRLTPVAHSAPRWP